MMRKMIDVIAALLLGHCDFGMMAPHSHHTQTQHVGVWSFVMWQSTEHIFLQRFRLSLKKGRKRSKKGWKQVRGGLIQLSSTPHYILAQTQSHPPWKIVGSANTAPSPSPNLDLLCVKKECNNQFWSTMPIQEHDKKKGRQRTSFQHLRRHFYSTPRVRAR